mmetsp:Transcript_70427/g.187557  ORF Transcript_70427/g.187557 Transcript_70427/m.187557 type:complete len:202 (-) Transcript_70427:1298-1903(-)
MVLVEDHIAIRHVHQDPCTARKTESSKPLLDSGVGPLHGGALAGKLFGKSLGVDGDERGVHLVRDTTQNLVNLHPVLAFFAAQHHDQPLRHRCLNQTRHCCVTLVGRHQNHVVDFHALPIFQRRGKRSPVLHLQRRLHVHHVPQRVQPHAPCPPHRDQQDERGDHHERGRGQHSRGHQHHNAAPQNHRRDDPRPDWQIPLE